MSTFLVDTASELVDDLIDSIIKSTRLPVSQISYQNIDLVKFMAEEQQGTITTLIRSIREDYWLQNYDQAILPNVYQYPMPMRAAGGALVDMVFVDPGNNEIDIPHLDPSQLKVQSFLSFRPLWMGQGIFLQNDQLTLWPQTISNTSYKLRQKFERRPNLPTVSANCAKITNVNLASNQVTISVTPTAFVANYLVDIISNVGQFTSQGDNLQIQSAVGGVITFSSNTPLSSTVAVGMWVCPAGLTCVPQLPFEGYPLLVARAILRIPVGLGNQALFSTATKMAEDAEAKLRTLLTPRIKSSPKKFVNRNHVGGLYRILGAR